MNPFSVTSVNHKPFLSHLFFQPQSSSLNSSVASVVEVLTELSPTVYLGLSNPYVGQPSGQTRTVTWRPASSRLRTKSPLRLQRVSEETETDDDGRASPGPKVRGATPLPKPGMTVLLNKNTYMF